MSKRNQVRHHGGAVGTNADGTRLYASVPMSLARDGRLSAAARSIAMYVWSHDVRFGQSRNDVAEKLGMSVNTVGKALGALQGHGWLVREIPSAGEPRCGTSRCPTPVHTGSDPDVVRCNWIRN